MSNIQIILLFPPSIVYYMDLNLGLIIHLTQLKTNIACDIFWEFSMQPRTVDDIMSPILDDGSYILVMNICVSLGSRSISVVSSLFLGVVPRQTPWSYVIIFPC